MRLLLREVAGLAPSAVVCLSRGMMIGITDIRSDLESVFRSGDQYCFVRKQSGNSVISKRSYYYCARKRNGLLLRSENAVVPLRSGTQWFFVLTPVVTGARNPKKVLFKGDWSQSR